MLMLAPAQVSGSPLVISSGAFCFGIVVGYVTYRTLARATTGAAISDIAAVIGAVGGAAVTALYNPEGDSFGWYSIGLATGMATYLVLSLAIRGRTETAAILAEGDPTPIRRDKN